MNSSKTQIQYSNTLGSLSYRPKLIRVGLKLLILAWLFGNTAHADDCVKQVFNSYCLGGNINTILNAQETPPEAFSLENGDTNYTLTNTSKTVIITAHNDTISNVTRHETPGDWINYTAWKVKLVRLYGKGEDLSDFPRYASSRSSRLNALNAGKGHAEFIWDQQSHIIKLVWDSPDFIKLSYQLTTNEAAEPENSEGL